MSKKNLTHLNLIIDGSATMRPLQTGIIRGINALLESQLKVPGELTVSLITFNTDVDIRSDFLPVKDSPILTNNNFKPRNQSALLDAIGTAVVEAQESIKVLGAAEEPESLLTIIVTDGEDTISSKYDRRMIKSMVEAKRKQLDWEFIFVCTDEDAEKKAKKIGIDPQSALSVVPNEPGILLALQSSNRILTDYRGAKLENCKFSVSDHERQQELSIRK